MIGFRERLDLEMDAWSREDLSQTSLRVLDDVLRGVEHRIDMFSVSDLILGALNNAHTD